MGGTELGEAGKRAEGDGEGGPHANRLPRRAWGEEQWWWDRLRGLYWGTLTVWEARGRGRPSGAQGSGKRGGEWGGKTVRSTAVGRQAGRL